MFFFSFNNGNFFNPICLKEMDGVKLLNRIDSKFIFRIELLPDILNELKQHYRILQIDNNNMMQYETLYFDTHNFKLYTDHQNGRLNRYKVRYRKYINSNVTFFEIKFKNNKKRTIKDRLKQENIEYSINQDTAKLIDSKTCLNKNELEPKIWVNYQRITLVNNNLKERLTIDLNLSFLSDDKYKDFPKLVIAELKQGKHENSHFIKIMREHSIHKQSISKYCLGVSSLFDNVKKNNIKPLLLLINKKYYD
ncbi:MAG: hypothetical protein A2X02_07775 [Bacteroidetes bacterium GWF2_29_10]|nr:MAG: hypothetical protein A2X02_07775 [Bacteroidetes bacterium GWF2_29_10]